ncbi:hypothetical protein EDB85DRAFT_1899446 [Lactarius pseudohatsudake]|nr:hypothetical protein EDB85DRAFT_1899446 [Lactarius pseudohatsudake]
MQGKSSEMKQGVSESEENSFKEAMQSAFWNGVTLLNGMGSDVGQHQQGIAGPSSPSADAEGFSEVPKRPSKGCFSTMALIARDRLNLLKAKESEKIKRLDDLLCELDDEIVLVDALIGGIGNYNYIL